MSTMLTLPHLVDLALGSPEVGAVNFNVLHTLLHVIIQQLNLLDLRVEFRGSNADRMQVILQTAPVTPLIRISEYIIGRVSSTSLTTEKESKQGLKEKDSPTGGKKEKSSKDKKQKKTTDEAVVEGKQSKKEREKEGTGDEKAKSKEEKKSKKDQKKQKSSESLGVEKGDTPKESSRPTEDGGEVTTVMDTKAAKKRKAEGKAEGRTEKRATEPLIVVAPPSEGKVEADTRRVSVKLGKKAERGASDEEVVEVESLSVVGDSSGAGEDYGKGGKGGDATSKDKKRSKKTKDGTDDAKDADEDGKKKRKKDSKKQGVDEEKETEDQGKKKVTVRESDEEFGSELEIGQKVVLVTSYDGSDTTSVRHVQSRSIRPSWRKTMDLDGLDELDRKMSQLQEVVANFESLPSNDDLLNRTRSQAGPIKPVSDMWNILNLTKRMDAAEQGIEKLTSLTEDLAKENDVTMKALQAMSPGIGPDGEEINLERYLALLDKRLCEAESKIGAEVVQKPRAFSSGSLAGKTTDEVLLLLRGDVQTLRQDVDMLVGQFKQFAQITDSIPFDALHSGVKEIGDLKEQLECFSGSIKAGVDSGILPDMDRLNALEEQIKACRTQIEGFDANFSSQMEAFQSQISELERELGQMLERLNSTPAPMGETFTEDLSGLNELYAKIQALQSDMDNVNTTASQLLDDREERDTHLNVLIEQIEVLKTVKADREDLEDALADKADQLQVNRKVSHDQFDAACDDLSRGMEEALAKLTQQEEIWHQALDDIQREIENKLDKIEITPLKDFVNSKLKSLQERLKALASIRRDSEAAGTKKRLLKDVNCISCDKNVVMNMDSPIPAIPASEPMPPTRSMRPYLTYELDQVRRQQRRLPQGRNMLHFEEAMNEGGNTGRGRLVRSETHRGAEHLCNRYCGGSHTVTTPQQRVTRVGHFLTQWGPECIPLQQEGAVRGTDGQLYKGAQMVPAARGDGPSPPPGAAGLPKTSSPIDVVHSPRGLGSPRGTQSQRSVSSVGKGSQSPHKEGHTPGVQSVTSVKTPSGAAVSGAQSPRQEGQSPRRSSQQSGVPSSVKGSHISMSAKGSQPSVKQPPTKGSQSTVVPVAPASGAQVPAAEGEKGSVQPTAEEAPPAEGESAPAGSPPKTSPTGSPPKSPAPGSSAKASPHGSPPKSPPTGSPPKSPPTGSPPKSPAPGSPPKSPPPGSPPKTSAQASPAKTSPAGSPPKSPPPGSPPKGSPAASPPKSPPPEQSGGEAPIAE